MVFRLVPKKGGKKRRRVGKGGKEGKKGGREGGKEERREALGYNPIGSDVLAQWPQSPLCPQEPRPWNTFQVGTQAIAATLPQPPGP